MSCFVAAQRYTSAMNPTIDIHWLAVIVATVASFIFGFLWWGPIFGRTWARALGLPMDGDFSGMVKPMLLNLTGNFLTSYVLVFSTNVWRASAWGLSPDLASGSIGFFSGLFTWMGFYIPLLLNQVAWEKRPWNVFLINAGGHLLSLQLIAQIVAHWR